MSPVGFQQTAIRKMMVPLFADLLETVRGEIAAIRLNIEVGTQLLLPHSLSGGMVVHNRPPLFI